MESINQTSSPNQGLLMQRRPAIKNEVVLSINDNLDKNKQDKEKNIKAEKTPLNTNLKTFVDNLSSPRKNERKSYFTAFRGVTGSFISIDKLKMFIPLRGISLGIFSKTNRFRRICWVLINNNKIFEYIIILCIICSLIVQILDNPLLRDQSLIKVIFYIDLTTTIIFLFEFVFKVISFGLLFNGRFSYLKNWLNLIDLLSLLISMLTNIINIMQLFYPDITSDFNNDNQSILSSNNSKVYYLLRIIKILRILRLLKIIEKSKFLQALSKTLIESFKQMLNIILIGMIFIFIFSIFGITYFGGTFDRCDFSQIPKIYNSEYFFNINEMSLDKLFNEQNKFDLSLINNIKTKWDCLDYGGVWINPYPNFDSLRTGFILLFEMLTTENWTFFMFSALDSNKHNYQPIKNNNYPFLIFFFIYMIFAYFFMLNFSFAILSDNFTKEKENIKNLTFKNPIQNEFYKIYENIYKIKLPPPHKKIKMDKLSKILMSILDSIYFDVVITCCIIANMVLLMMNWPGMDTRTVGFINYMNEIFNYIFIFEAVLKIYVYRFFYFLNGWNVIDFLIVFNSFFTLILKSTTNFFSNFFDTSILRAIRVARILRILKKAKTLNKIFNLFIDTIKPIINVGILYLVLLFVYAIIGMNIFSHIKHQKIISEKWNFENFTNSIFLLIRINSGDSWNLIMHECLKERQLNFFCKYSHEMNEEDQSSKLYFLNFRWKYTMWKHYSNSIFFIFCNNCKYDVFTIFFCNNGLCNR